MTECTVCGKKDLHDTVVDYSERNFDKPLCRDCQEEMEEPSESSSNGSNDSYSGNSNSKNINRQSAVKSACNLYNGKGSDVSEEELQSTIKSFNKYIEQGEF